ncbi:MAG: hypothetical protein LKF53_05235 [Solobacterium sp.]|jgi:hypothetical protein|nr:hypothetical protein [Solobacterium sp.]MCH4205777.1 hypothetical protein [Solobacterium sp.]MCH4227301.1 hypothetical protein [Solobacterium sp.]
MKKKIISIVMMIMVALAIMPVYTVQAEEVSANLTLTEDRTEQIKIPAGATVTLDLAGYNITVADADAIINSGSLTIVDSGRKVGETTVYGTVTASTAVRSAVLSLPGSTTIINGGTYTGQYYVVRDYGTMIINDGTFHSSTDYNTTASGAGAAMIHVGWELDSGDSTDTILTNGGNIDRGNTVAQLTINGGTYDITGSTSTMCIKAVAYSKIVINGGDFTGLSVMHSWWDATINGGTFKNDGTAVITGKGKTETRTENQGVIVSGGIYSAQYEPADYSPKMVINGGVFTTALAGNHVFAYRLNDSITTIYGGTFNGLIGAGLDGADPTTVDIYGGKYTTTSDLTSYIKGESTTSDGVITVSTSSISTITKYLIYKSAPTDTEFTYTISNVNGNETGDTVLQEASKTGTTTLEEVRDGITPSKVKFTNSGASSTTLSFNVNDFNSGALVSSLVSPTLGAEAEALYTAKTFTVDFSEIAWANPGIFRYAVTETSNNEKVPSSGKLYFDVWVTRLSSIQGTDDYNKFHVTAVVAHTDNLLEYNTETKVISDKTSYLTSTSRVKAMNLTVKHYADGNQASKTEEYTYTLNLTGATKGSTITWIKSDNTQGSITVDSAGAYTYPFKLKASEYIVFKSISEDPGYTVTADEAVMKAETLTTVTSIEQDYSTGTAADSDTKTDDLGANTDIILSPNTAPNTNISDSKYAISDTYMQANTTVAFTIYKVGTIPTGVIVSVAPYAAVALAGFAGILVFAAKKKRKDDDDE